MNFLNPFFLFGLLAAAIPVVIHLINLRRPQKITFSTLSFFNELRKSTIRRIRIKQYMLMALRIMALLFLALALARPFLPPTLGGTTGSGEPKAIAIVIDNSPSMSRVGNQGPLMDQAKEVASRIIQNANSDDKFFIVTTNGGEVVQSSLINGSRALERVSEITAVNTGHYTRERFKAAYEQLQNAPLSQGIVYVVTDAQESQLADLRKFAKQNNERAQANPITVQPISLEPGKQQNIAVSSVELQSQMVSKGSPLTLSVQVENTGDAPAANQFVSLEVEGNLAGEYEVSLDTGESREFLFQVVPERTGSITGRVILEGDEIDYDNHHYFALRIPESRSLLLVNNNKGSSSFTSYLTPALEAAEKTNAQLTFQERQVPDVDQSQWSQYDAVVLDGLRQIPDYWFQDLQRYVQEGNGILFFPSEQGDIENYNRFFSLFNAGEFVDVRGEYGSFDSIGKMAELEEGHPVLEEVFEKKEDEKLKVDLSSLFYYFHYRDTSESGTLNILEASNGDPLLTEQQFGEGIIMISTFGTDPGWSNLPINPLFAPLYYRSTLYVSSSERAGLQKHWLGTPFVWENTFQSAKVTLEINESEYKPEVQRKTNGLRIIYKGTEWEPGILSVKTVKSMHKVAVNQHIMESRFATLTEGQWQNIFGNTLAINETIRAKSLSSDDLNEKLSATMFGKEIWNWFIWAAFLFLIIETVVSRLYKAEGIG